MRGIRFRVTLLAVGVLFVVFLATAVALLGAQRRLLTANLDETLETHALALFDHGNAPILDARGDDDSVAQITTLDGEIIATTANFVDGATFEPLQPGVTRRLRTQRLFEGEPNYRVLSVGNDSEIIHVASPTDDIDESLSALRRSLAATAPVAAAVLAALSWWLVGRTLRPVEAIRAEVANISGHNLHRRVPEPASNDEIGRLASTMNAMLDRVQKSSEAQQRFVADASHELRTPLTRIRSEVEVDLAHPETAALLATHRSVLDETVGMQQLVDDLLTLARLDAALTTALLEPVDLHSLVLHEVARRERAGPASARPVSIEAGQLADIRVAGNPNQLGRALRNLLDNATRHAASRVTITLTRQDRQAHLTVSDDGPGVPASHHDAIFERFTRVDEARTDGGAGLGLAITRSIVELHGGTLTLDPATLNREQWPGATFVIDLPIST